MTKKNQKTQENQEADMPAQSAADAIDDIAAESAPTKQMSTEELQAALEAEQAKSADYWERLLRKEAELQNVRRRAEQGAINARRYALEKFAGELLVVADSFEKALEVSQNENISVAALKEGSELTFKILIDILNKHDIKSLDPTGKAFDPAQHEALTMVPSDDVPPNHVLNVVQKGYTLHGRIIRPAKVIVAKASD